MGIFLALSIQQAALKDVHIAPTPLGSALQQLESIFGERLEVGAKLRDRVILIEANQVSGEELRFQIAKTLNSNWEKTSTGWHLYQDPKQLAQEKANIIQVRRRLLRNMFEDRIASLKRSPVYTETDAFNALIKQRTDQGFLVVPWNFYTPDERLATRIIQKIGIDTLAAIEPNTRVVFTSRPNAMQRAFNFDWTEDYEKFEAESEIFERARAKLASANGVWKISKEDVRSPKDLCLTAFCNEMGFLYLDIEGIKQDSGSTENIWSGASIEAFVRIIFNREANKASKPKSAFEYKPSPLTAEFNLFHGTEGSNLPNEKWRDLVVKFGDPVAVDPLTYLPGDALRAIAKREKKNMVALVDDNMYTADFEQFDEQFFEDGFVKFLDPFISFDSAWMRINVQPIGSFNVPRTLLKKIVNRVQSQGFISLRDEIDLLMSDPTPGQDLGMHGYLNDFQRLRVTTNFENAGARILGYMSQSDWERAMSPEGLPFTEMSGSMQREIYCAIFNQRRPELDHEEDQKVSKGYTRQEVTNILPTGIPYRARLHLKQVIEPVVRSLASGEESTYPMTARAWGESTREQIEDSKDAADHWKKTHENLVRGSYGHYILRLDLGSNYTWASTSIGYLGDIGKPFRFDQWPSDLKSAFESGLNGN